MNYSKNAELSRKIFYFCAVATVLVLFSEILLRLFGKSLLGLNKYPCFFNSLTGLYCPGCGGTRSVYQLMRGHVLKSIYFNPVVPYTAVMWSAYLISHTVSLLFRGKIKPMAFSPIYLYIYIVILLLNFAVKNGVVLLFGIHLI